MMTIDFTPHDVDALHFELWRFVKGEVPSCRSDDDLARFKAAIVACLDQVEGEHKSAIASLLTLKFQTFDEPQLLAGRHLIPRGVPAHHPGQFAPEVC